MVCIKEEILGTTIYRQCLPTAYDYKTLGYLYSHRSAFISLMCYLEQRFGGLYTQVYDISPPQGRGVYLPKKLQMCISAHFAIKASLSCDLWCSPQSFVP